MNIRDAAAICYGEEAAHIRRRELESEAEAERMAVKLFSTQAAEAAGKANRARNRLLAITTELREMGVLMP